MMQAIVISVNMSFVQRQKLIQPRVNFVYARFGIVPARYAGLIGHHHYGNTGLVQAGDSLSRSRNEDNLSGV
jgi:hypothetical protein